jgi:hypothetical protein
MQRQQRQTRDVDESHSASTDEHGHLDGGQFPNSMTDVMWTAVRHRRALKGSSIGQL